MVLGGLPLATGRMTRKKTHPSRVGTVREASVGFSFPASRFCPISHNIIRLALVSCVNSGSPEMIAFSLEDGGNDFFFRLLSTCNITKM